MAFMKFVKDWQEAIDAFNVISVTQNLLVRQVVAEADTGSVYRASAFWLPDRRWIAVSSPWERVYPSSDGDYIHPAYLQEKWGNNRTAHVHGGDLAAIALTIHVALGFEQDALKEKYRPWASDAAQLEFSNLPESEEA